MKRFKGKRRKGLALGRILRDESVDLTESTEERAAWRRRAYAVALQLAYDHPEGTVTTDDLEDVFPVPDEWDRRILGAVFNPRKAGFAFERIGRMQSQQPQCHGRDISIWRLVDEIHS